MFKEEQELFDKGIIPGTARFHLHGENEEDVWPSDESEDEDFKQKNEKDDGKTIATNRYPVPPFQKYRMIVKRLRAVKVVVAVVAAIRRLS